MRRFLGIVIGVVLMAGCAPTSDQAETSTSATPAVSTTVANTEPEQVAPSLEVTDPVYGSTVTTREYRFEGTTDAGSAVTADGSQWASVDPEGNWSVTLKLSPGENEVTFVATGSDEATYEVRHRVYYLALPTRDGGVWQRWGETNRIMPNGTTVGPDGDVWVSTLGGLVRWEVETDTYREVIDRSWPEQTPSSIVFDSGGDVWLGFYNEVLRWHGETWDSYEFSPESPDWSPIQLAVGPDGDIWAGAPQFGIYRFADGEWRLLDGTLPGRGDVDNMAVDTYGRFWMGTFWSGLWVLDQGVWWQEDNRPVAVVTSAANGDVWYAIRDMQDPSHERSSVVQVHKLSAERTVYEMGETSVWEIATVGEAAYVGTNSGPIDASELHGLWYLEDGVVTETPGHWDDIQRQILGVAVDGHGTVWLGGQGGLWSWDGVEARHHPTNTFNAFSIEYGGPASDGSVFVGDCSSVSRLVDGTWSPLPDTPVDMWGCRAVVDGEGVLWVAGSGGLLSFDGSEWTHYSEDVTGEAWGDLYPPVEGEGDESPRWDLVVVAGEVEAAVLGTDRIWVFSNGAWTPAGSVLPDWAGAILDLAADDGGSLWVLSQGGAHVLIDGSWTHYRAGAAGPPQNAFVIGSGGGLVWVSSSEEQVRFDGVDWTRFERSPFSFSRDVFVDPAGGIWGQDAEGAVRFDGTTSRLSPEFAGDGVLSVLGVDPEGTWWFSDGAALYHWEPSE